MKQHVYNRVSCKSIIMAVSPAKPQHAAAPSAPLQPSTQGHVHASVVCCTSRGAVSFGTDLHCVPQAQGPGRASHH